MVHDWVRFPKVAQINNNSSIDMKEVYYVNTQTYSKDCLMQALAKGIQLLKSDSNIKPIVIIVPTTNQFSLLSEFFSTSDIKNRCCAMPELKAGIRFETVKTYRPSVSDNHILITLCVSPKDLIPFEDEWGAKYWIVVPWIFDEMDSWLKVHSAIDIATGTTIANEFSIDEKVQNGIGWLKATSYPNEGFHHPLDSNRLKCMANAIASCGYIVDYNSVLYYCINHGINHDGGRKIADALMKAQTRKFKTDGNYPLRFLKEMMNEKHEEI